MSYADLREFLSHLEARGDLKRIAASVSPRLEMTEICDRVLRAGGPALLFERPAGHDMPVTSGLAYLDGFHLCHDTGRRRNP